MVQKLFASAVLSLAVALPTTLWAQSPHFVYTTDSVNTSTGADGGDLTVAFKQAGLGKGETVTYTVSASASASYACVNAGGNHPQASNKETFSGTPSFTQPLTADHSGNITGSFPLEEPAPDPSFSCPGGMSLVLASVSWTNVTLTDSLGDSFSLPDRPWTFCDLNNLTKATVKNCAVAD